MSQNLAPICRLNEQGLTALVGQDAVALLQRRLRGGASGHKGVRYEQLFGTHRIARLIRKLVDTGDDAVVEWQSKGFVDDFVVRRDGIRSFKGYQLKDAEAVSWTAGNQSIESDFALQHAVCQAEGYDDVRLRLVCSRAPLIPQLEASVPARIAPYAKSFFFPHGPTLLPIMMGYDWMTDDFAYLSRNDHPTRIEVSQVAGVLMGAWDFEAPTALVSAVMGRARDMSPTLLRTLQSDEAAAA